MRVSHRWLTELLPGLSAPVEELAERLTMLGVLVEEIVRADRGLESVVLGRVSAVSAHPAADRLKLCAVEAGAGPLRQIVCGAPVVREGGYYPIALPGARLPGGLAVEASEIRGVRSEGMICSAPELGLDHLGPAEGILELDAEGRAPGSPVAPLLGLDDTVLVLEVPSNRPDWESHLGVARELQELAGERLRPPGRCEEPARAMLGEGSAEASAGADSAGGVTVRLLDSTGCPRYTGVVVRQVRVGPGPLRVQQRLFALGVRPINNVVDATNYVLLEVGTPIHAFDLRRVRGGEIRIRRAEPGERLVTLDGKERALDSEMTVIADGEGAIAIGGVMGGGDSEVSAATGEIFLEAAFFDPDRIRRTAARLGLRTEASHRFGRGVDPTAVPIGRWRAVELIGAWSGGSPEGRAIDIGIAARPPLVLELRADRVSAVTGLRATPDCIRGALAGIDLEAQELDGRLRVTVPGHRFDLVREIDLVEDVTRRIGYEGVPAQPLPLEPGAMPAGEPALLAELRERLRGLGLDEAYTTSFFDPTPFGEGFYEGRMLEQANPLARNERYLRPTLVATLLLAARHNLRRGRSGVAFYEMGHVFSRRDDVLRSHRLAPEERPADRTQSDWEAVGAGNRAGSRVGSDLPALPGVEERRTLGILLAGSPQPLHWSAGGRRIEADFYDLKGLVEALTAGAGELTVEPSRRTWLHPGQQADLGLRGSRFGFLGRLHPRVERALDLEARALVAELELAPLLRQPAPSRFAAISSFPRVERDLALVVPEERTAAEIQELLRAAALANLVEARLFDVYRGDQIPPGTRSLAFRLVFQSTERTLTEDDVEREIRKLLALLGRAGVHIR